MQALRDAWHEQFEGIDPDRLVFLDESGAKNNLCRLRGRGRIGQRVVGKVPHGRWHTSTILSAVGLRGPFAPAVFDGPVDADVFGAYVEQVLRPALRPGDWVILDNLGPHKAAGVRDSIESAGARVLYLPPYSPDFNPIENLWSKLKAYLRSVGARRFEALCDAIAEGLERITLRDCKGFFQNCGYATC